MSCLRSLAVSYGSAEDTRSPSRSRTLLLVNYGGCPRLLKSLEMPSEPRWTTVPSAHDGANGPHFSFGDAIRCWGSTISVANLSTVLAVSLGVPIKSYPGMLLVAFPGLRSPSHILDGFVPKLLKLLTTTSTNSILASSSTSFLLFLVRRPVFCACCVLGFSGPFSGYESFGDGHRFFPGYDSPCGRHRVVSSAHSSTLLGGEKHLPWIVASVSQAYALMLCAPMDC